MAKIKFAPLQPQAPLIDANGIPTKEAFEYLDNLRKLVEELKRLGVIT
jgi:hypothetical protein